MITTQLQNGGRVIAEAKRGDAHWVAAEWNKKFVSWSIAPRADGCFEAYHGHYFPTPEEALDHLAFRAFGLKRTD